LMWAPLIGLVVGRWYRAAVLTLAVALAVTAVPFLLDSDDRPLRGPDSVLSLSRSRVMFMNSPGRLAEYRTIADVIKASHPTTVGLVIGPDSWEYPLWVMSGGPLHGPAFVDVNPQDAGVAPVPAHQAMVCLDLPIQTCNAAVPPGWTVVPLTSRSLIATRNS
jgi:hypothetical protein